MARAIPGIHGNCDDIDGNVGGGEGADEMWARRTGRQAQSRCLTFLLGPGAHEVLFVPSKSLFPHSCVSSGDSTVGLMVTSSKRAYAKPRSAEPRAPATGHC